jgi:predicted RNase H-like HicB family nuclease
MKLRYTYWQEPDGWLLGHFDDYPEHMTQAKTVEELEFMLKDLYDLMEFGKEENHTSLKKGELEIA